MDKEMIIQKTYELATIIKESDIFQDFKKYEEMLFTNPETKELIEDFQQKKQKYEEASKYGSHYPGLKAILKDYSDAKIKLMNHKLFQKYKELEKQVERILYQIESELKSVIDLKDKRNKKDLKFL